MRRLIMADRRAGDAGSWWPILSGSAASLVGIGLARFAYTPLIPALVEARWFTASEAVYLGAANLAGYLAGALLGRPLATKCPAAALLRAMMVLATAAFFACGFRVGFAWFFLWRFSAGLAGGALMVLAAPSVLPHVAPARRGLAAGAIFTGVGLGIAASGTLVPFLLRAGLATTWLGLGGISLVLTAAAWGGWPKAALTGPEPRSVGRVSKVGQDVRLRALYIEYGLNAVGLVPHMLFLVDFVARGLGRGIAAGAEAWVVFGLGALAGPVLTGYAADRIGFGRALRLAFLIQAASVLLLAGPVGQQGGLFVSSFVVGAFVPGIVPLVLGRTHELVVEPRSRQAAWGIATIAFALGQAGAGYGYSFLFARTGAYALLFALGAAALVLALGIDLLAAIAKQRWLL